MCEQLITGFSQLIQKGNIIINLLLACVILFYDVIAYTLILVLSICKIALLRSVPGDYFNQFLINTYDDFFQGIYN